MKRYFRPRKERERRRRAFQEGRIEQFIGADGKFYEIELIPQRKH